MTTIDKFIQAAEPAKLGIPVSLTSAEAVALAEEVTKLRQRLEQVEAEAAESRTVLVKDYGVMKRAEGALDKADERIRDLEQRLAAAEALVPTLEPLEWAADLIEIYAPDWPDWTERDIAVATVSVFRDLAAAARDWRKEQGQEGESDGD